MKRPNLIASFVSIYWAGTALIATSRLVSGSQYSASLQAPPPPPPQSGDRVTSPLHALGTNNQQQDEEQYKSNQNEHNRGISAISDEKRRPPPPPPQRPSVSDVSLRRNQQQQIVSPPPRIQASAVIATNTNNFTRTKEKSLGAEETIAMQKTQQQMRQIINELPARQVHPSQATDIHTVGFLESNRQEDQRERRPLTVPPGSHVETQMTSDYSGIKIPSSTVLSRPGIASAYHQPLDMPPRRPGMSQTPQQRQYQRPGQQLTGQKNQIPPPRSTGNWQMQSKRQPSPPAWTKLWKRVERGLDGLADLEDVVAGRAQQLYSTAKESVSSVYNKRPLNEKNTANDHLSTSTTSPMKIWSKPRSKDPVAAPIPQMDMSRFTKRMGTEERAPSELAPPARKETLPWEHAAMSSSPPTAPYTNSMIKESTMTRETTIALYDTTSKSSETSQQVMTSLGLGSTKSFPDKSGNTTTRMIRANGGASAPPPAVEINDPLRQPQTPGERPMAPVGHHLPSRTISPERRAPQQTPRPIPKRFMDDDEEEHSIVQKMMKALPGIPRFSFFRRNRFDTSASDTWDAWNKDDTDVSKTSPGFFGRIFRSKRSQRSSSRVASPPVTKHLSTPLQSFMERCDDGKTLSLLKSSEMTGCRSIGRTLATLDVVALVFALIGLKQLPHVNHLTLPHSVSEVMRVTLPNSFQCFVSGMDTWAPFAFLAAFLTIQTRQLIYRAKATSLSQTLDASISEEAQYGALFLRLYTSSPYIQNISDRIRAAVRLQLMAKVDLTRLRALVTIFLSSMLLMTVPVVTPLVVALFGTLQHICGIEPLYSWPPKWHTLIESIASSWSSFASKATELISEELAHMADHPKQVIVGLSIAGALAFVSALPGTGRRNVAAERAETDEEDDDEQCTKFTTQLSNLGISSANRIALLSDVGGIDSALERWRLLIPRGTEVTYTRKSLQSTIHVLSKGAISATVLSLPLLLHQYYGFPLSSTRNSLPSWSSLIDVSSVLFLTQFLTWKALSSLMLADEARGSVAGFVKSVRNAANERLSRLHSSPVNLQQQAAISPSAGLEIKDLWAAHTTKRAWAVRGVSLECRNGNILVILGDDSAGKSRLLTALAEAVSCPPRQALTTTRVRGSILVAGVELNRWDRKLLQKRVWSVLHDVRSMSDLAQILSGMSLEEILEPSGGIRYLELLHRPGPNERATMMLALKLAGLYSTLLPKLPSKLSTVVTANEEDIKPSALRPLSSILAPAEWSKLLFARVISQAIYENDNAASTNESIENCLIGSLLLLDDATLYLPEVEEARMLRDLRSTGAATVMTSNRWALGRLADQIVVLRDGAVVESGTHAELLSRGPQQSLYAAKWHAMSS